MGAVRLLLMKWERTREARNQGKPSRLYIMFCVVYYSAKLDTVSCQVATSTHPLLGHGLDSSRTDYCSPLHMTTQLRTFVTAAGTPRHCGCMKPIKYPVHNFPVDGRLFTGRLFAQSSHLGDVYHQRSVTSESSEL